MDMDWTPAMVNAAMTIAMQRFAANCVAGHMVSPTYVDSTARTVPRNRFDFHEHQRLVVDTETLNLYEPFAECHVTLAQLEEFSSMLSQGGGGDVEPDDGDAEPDDDAEQSVYYCCASRKRIGSLSRRAFFRVIGRKPRPARREARKSGGARIANESSRRGHERRIGTQGHGGRTTDSSDRSFE